TAMGAAYLAGLATGYWQDLDEIRTNWQLDKLFTPVMTLAQSQKQIAGWKKAVARCRNWAKE
ncbi:MAG: glycerol kinase, partial [Absicoccus porci]|nr:glycerol kinase [Absicoccus porci]